MDVVTDNQQLSGNVLNVLARYRVPQGNVLLVSTADHKKEVETARKQEQFLKQQVH
jgi:hypothetical protein